MAMFCMMDSNSFTSAAGALEGGGCLAGEPCSVSTHKASVRGKVDGGHHIVTPKWTRKAMCRWQGARGVVQQCGSPLIVEEGTPQTGALLIDRAYSTLIGPTVTRHVVQINHRVMGEPMAR